MGTLKQWATVAAVGVVAQACVISNPPIDLGPSANGGQGGASTGGASTGGASTGGASTGGASTGGASTGGTSTGGHGGVKTDASSVGGSGGEQALDASVDATLTADSGPDGEPSSPCGPCASGLCLDGGVCAECSGDEQCASPAPRCDEATHRCVACLPGATDNCDSTEYCSAALACVPGCKSNGACASDSCTSAHNCAPCLTDSECTEGRRCSSGQCLPTCSDSNGCPTGFTCCATRCAALAYDRSSCGACGAGCSSSEYCAGSACKTNTLAQLCDLTHANVLLDGLPVDDDASRQIGASISTGCSSGPTFQVESQDVSTALSRSTSRPLTNGENVFVEIGGPFGQKSLRYLENERVTAVYSFYEPDVAGFKARASDGGADPVLIQAPLGGTDAGAGEIGEGHDLFVIETIVDPSFGSRTIALYGLYSPGTSAAVWWFQHQVLPSLATYTKMYYVYEWTDEDGNQSPDAADTFRLVASG